MTIRKVHLVALMSLSLVLGAAAAAAGTSVGGSPSATTRIAALGVGTPGTEVLSVYNGTVDFTCTTFAAAGTGSHVLDRDNTGTGREAIRLDVTDGAGRQLFTLTYSNVLGEYPGGIIGTTPYTETPFFNPLTFTVTSLAGNGLAEHVDFVQQGACSTLPTFTTAVPTVSGVGLVVLIGLLASAAVLVLRKGLPV